VVFEPSDQPGKRFILTMYHIVKGGPVAGQSPPGTDELVIHTYKREKAQVEIIAADPRSDLAVLQIRSEETLKPASLKPIRFAETQDYKKGQFVFTLGNPYAIARDGSACAGMGMISNIARKPKPAVPGLLGKDKIRKETIHHQGTLLQIDGQLNLGTSGGAVLNRRGELIGLVTAMAALAGYEKSVGYAVPIHKGTKRVITELAHGYEVEYGLLGLHPVTVAFPQGEQPTAVRVDVSGSESPASKAGVSVGDVIYTINDTPVFNSDDLMREVAFIGPGQTATLKIFRPHTRQWLTKPVKLTKWPVLNDEGIIATNYRHAWNHLVIDYATARDDQFQSKQYVPGVLITHIQRTSPEEHSQLQVGDFITHVDNQPVRTPEEFDAVVQNKKSGTVELRLLENRPVTVHVLD
jgi:serine protease Do